MTTRVLLHRYEMDAKWRSAWISLANKPESRRSQARQDRIDERADLANRRIDKLMQRNDEGKNWTQRE